MLTGISSYDQLISCQFVADAAPRRSWQCSHWQACIRALALARTPPNVLTRAMPPTHRLTKPDRAPHGADHARGRTPAMRDEVGSPPPTERRGPAAICLFSALDRLSWIVTMTGLGRSPQVPGRPDTGRVRPQGLAPSQA
jgi:hypothetical protein